MTYKTEIEKAIVDHFMSQEMVDFYDIIKTSRMPNMWMGYLDDADHVDMAVGVANNQLHILASETVSEKKPIAPVFPLNRFERTVTKEMDADEDAIRVDFSGDVPVVTVRDDIALNSVKTAELLDATHKLLGQKWYAGAEKPKGSFDYIKDLSSDVILSLDDFDLNTAVELEQ